MSSYFEEIDLDWDPDKLFDILQSDPIPWVKEKNISNRYLRTKDEYIWNNLYDQIKEQGYITQGCYFAEMRPNTFLPIHKDYMRSAAINFPIVGDWDNSPLKIYNDTRTEVVAEHTYKPNQAIYFTTTDYHNVVNNSDQSRFILSISIVEPGTKFEDAEGNQYIADDKYIDTLVDRRYNAT